MNFERLFSLLNGASSDCSSAIVLLLAIAAYHRTKEWGFICWIVSASSAVLDTIHMHIVPILTYYGSLCFFSLSALAFTIGAVRIVRQYLQLFAAQYPPGHSRSDNENVV